MPTFKLIVIRVPNSEIFLSISSSALVTVHSEYGFQELGHLVTGLVPHGGHRVDLGDDTVVVPVFLSLAAVQGHRAAIQTAVQPCEKS